MRKLVAIAAVAFFAAVGPAAAFDPTKPNFEDMVAVSKLNTPPGPTAHWYDRINFDMPKCLQHRTQANCQRILTCIQQRSDTGACKNPGAVK